MRRKKYIENKKKERKKSKFYIVSFLGVILLIVLLLLAIFYWYSMSVVGKYSFVNRNEATNQTEIYVVDTKNDFLKKYALSNDILLESSYGYGEYSLNNLWLLSEKEKIGGNLITKSINKNFLIPVYYYMDGRKTNMELVRNIKSRIIVKRNIPADVTITSKNLTNSTLADFVNEEIQEQALDITIDDYSGSYTLGENVSDIINVMGSKVGGYSRGYDENLDCEIYTPNENVLAEKLSRLFDCKIIYSSEQNGIKLRVGKKFLMRF